jgi:hypothetical protein
MANKHDNLCLDSEGRTEGMQYCWCNCSSCWSPEGLIHTYKKQPHAADKERVGLQKGRCICKHCPCTMGLGMGTLALPIIVLQRHNEGQEYVHRM